jgi:hypothetical protein
LNDVILSNFAFSNKIQHYHLYHVVDDRRRHVLSRRISQLLLRIKLAVRNRKSQKAKKAAVIPHE